jgi:hypothetical protein
MSIQDIEAAIKTLPKEELAQFDQWYQAFHEEQWDEQIRRDVKSGKLDFLLKEAQSEREAGTLRQQTPVENLLRLAKTSRPKSSMGQILVEIRPAEPEVTNLNMI